MAHVRKRLRQEANLLRRQCRMFPLLRLLRQILSPLGWEIARANFMVPRWAFGDPYQNPGSTVPWSRSGPPAQSSARSTQNAPGRHWTCTSSCSSVTTKYWAETPRGSRWTKQCWPLPKWGGLYASPPAMSSQGDNRTVLHAHDVTRSWLPRAQQHSEALMDTKAHTPPTVPRTYNNLSDQSSNSALVSCSVSNFMADNVTSICPILPQSPPHGIAPRVDVARSRFGRLFLQLLPLVSNKHLISLSLSLSLSLVSGMQTLISVLLDSRQAERCWGWPTT